MYVWASGKLIEDGLENEDCGTWTAEAGHEKRVSIVAIRPIESHLGSKVIKDLGEEREGGSERVFLVADEDS